MERAQRRAPEQLLHECRTIADSLNTEAPTSFCPSSSVHPPFPALNLVLPGGMVTPAAPLSGHPRLTWDLDGASGSGDMTPTSTPCGRAPSLSLEVGMTSAETFPVHGF